MDAAVPCSKDTRNRCDYYRFAQGGGDALDIVSLLFAYLVLWVQPEKMLFPAGFVLYTISGLFSTIKLYTRKVHIIIRVIDTILMTGFIVIAFLGMNNQLTCSILSGISFICLGPSLHSLIPLNNFHTLYLLVPAGIPLITTGIRYIMAKR